MEGTYYYSYIGDKYYTRYIKYIMSNVLLFNYSVKINKLQHFFSLI